MTGNRILKQAENVMSMLYILQDMVNSHEDSIVAFEGQTMPKTELQENVKVAVLAIESILLY